MSFHHMRICRPMILRRVVSAAVFAFLISTSNLALASGEEAARFIHRLGDRIEQIFAGQNLLGRTSGGATQSEKVADIVLFGEWSLDLASHTMIGPDGEDLSLTPAEFNLLTCFVRAPNRVLTRNYLLDAISQHGEAPTDRTIDLVVSRLRKKIERDPGKPSIIVTVRGCGYKLTAWPS